MPHLTGATGISGKPCATAQDGFSGSDSATGLADANASRLLALRCWPGRIYFRKLQESLVVLESGKHLVRVPGPKSDQNGRLAFSSTKLDKALAGRYLAGHLTGLEIQK